MAKSDSNETFVNRFSTQIIVAALVALCVAIYGQTYQFDFINIDDRPYIYENTNIAGGLNGKSIWWAITAVYSGNWHRDRIETIGKRPRRENSPGYR